MKAFCWRNGRIEFGHRVPPGAICIGSGPDRKLRAAVEVLARHGYEKGTLLVPGIPEAEMIGTDPVQAAITFSRQLQQRLMAQPVTQWANTQHVAHA